MAKLAYQTEKLSALWRSSVQNLLSWQSFCPMYSQCHIQHNDRHKTTKLLWT